MLSTAQVDAFIASYDSKVSYGFWRPVTAINTTTDPNWTPLLAAPPFPSYVANHATVAEAGAAVLAAMFGSDAANFSLTFDTDHSSAPSLGNPTFGPITLDFTSFSEAATETGMSRIWGGIHYIFDVETGFTVADEVAANALDRFAVPEPASMGLLAMAFLGVLLGRKKPDRK